MRESGYERASFGAKVAGGAMAGILLVSGCTPTGEQSSSPQIDNATSITQIPTTAEVFTGPYPVTAPFNIETDNCVEPTPEELETVNQLLINPGDPELIQAARSMGKGGGGAIGETGSTTSNTIQEAAPVNAYQDRIDELAKEYGRTVIDGRTEMGLLSKDFGLSADGGKESSPFAYYLETTQAFASKFGVTVSVGTPDKTYSYNGRAPEPEVLESDNAKLTMLNIIQAYSGKTQEYVTGLAGLKNIVLITGTEGDALAYAGVSESEGTFYINIDPREEAFAFDVSGMMHETYHLYDSRTCGIGGMFKDPTFDSLNQGLDIYDDPDADDLVFPYTSLDQYQEDFNKRNEYMYKAQEAGNVEGYCAASRLDKQQADQVMAISSRYPNPAEDKADMGSIMTQPYRYQEFASTRFRTLSAKFRFVLARLYHQDPDEVKFLLAQVPPMYQDPTETIC